MAGNAAHCAAVSIVEKIKLAASAILEAEAQDLELSNGRVHLKGVPDHGKTLAEIARALAGAPGFALPGNLPPGLFANSDYMANGLTYTNGSHVCEVEVDPATGVTEITRYSMVGDFGTVVNPVIVRGQVIGGVVQGIGQCLMENTIYTEDGQLASGSFMDYAMPRADDAPMFQQEFMSFPATTNPLGVKGCGEAGCAGSLISIMNAIVDALSPLGVTHIDMPATPALVWAAIQQAKGKKAA